MILTVFTPTYNRAHLLERVYKSLLEQTRYDFEWVIVDDGSSDNTEEVVNKMICEAKLNIQYIKKENGGKHTAHNMALHYAKGELFMCVDSDDVLETKAVEIIADSFQYLQANDCGFIAYKSDMEAQILCTEIPSNINEHNSLCNLTAMFDVKGEFAFVFKTDIARVNLFPVIEGEKFIGECVLYDRLDMQGFTWCPIRNVLQKCEYQKDGYTSNLNKIMNKNPGGYCLYFMQRIDLQSSFLKKLIHAGKYKCFCIFSKGNRSKYIGKNKLMVFLSTPLGIIFWLYYKVYRGF